MAVGSFDLVVVGCVDSSSSQAYVDCTFALRSWLLTDPLLPLEILKLGSVYSFTEPSDLRVGESSTLISLALNIVLFFRCERKWRRI